MSHHGPSSLITLFLLLWLLPAFLIGLWGGKKSIGFGLSFVLSLLLSPLVGIIAVLASKDKQQAQMEQQLTQALAGAATGRGSVSDELTRLQGLRDGGQLTEAEYTQAKAKVLAA